MLAKRADLTVSGINILYESIKRKKHKRNLTGTREKNRVLLEASRVFGYTTKQSTFFTETDPMNNNKVTGAYCRVFGKFFGALYISSVNGEFIPQVVYTLPTLEPFCVGKIKSKEKFVLGYMREKFEGISITGFKYTDGKDIFVSYKPRLAPFISNTTFLDTFTLWKRILLKYPGIENSIRQRFNVAFEMFGSQIPSPINYSTGLDVVTITSIMHDGTLTEIIDERLPDEASPLISTMAKEEFVTMYGHVQKVLNSLNSNSIRLNNKVSSSGLLVQLYDDRSDMEFKMFNMYPKAMNTFSYVPILNSAIVTQMSLKQPFSGTILTYDTVSKSLSSRYNKSFIVENSTQIMKCIGNLNEASVFRRRVLDLLRRNEISFIENKTFVMDLVKNEFKSEDPKKQLIGKAYEILDTRFGNIERLDGGTNGSDSIGQ